MPVIPSRQIRAVFDDSTIRVYQAYGHRIADSALAAGTFVEPEFKMTRMSWIKPSFLWMMYRSGWGQKDAGQCRVLAVDISRAGFEWALANSCLSHPPALSPDEARELMGVKPVRVQWDPERDIHHNPLNHRSIQVGLRDEAIQRYVNDWVTKIEDITPLVHALGDRVAVGDLDGVSKALPPERSYPLSSSLAAVVGATDE